MSATTPTKRRVLGSLDVNVQKSPRSLSKLSHSAAAGGLAGSPLKRATISPSPDGSLSRHATPSPSRKVAPRKETPKKRRLEEGADACSAAVKKLCSESEPESEPESATGPVSEANAKAPLPTVDAADEARTLDDEPPASPTTGRRSTSPDASSLFDTSAINTSQVTNITEPDHDTSMTATVAAPVAGSSTSDNTLASLPPSRPHRRPTRKEFRQNAEILKLRLSLATYKVKTGQTDVPLDKLQIRPVPGMARRCTPLPSMSAHTIQRATPAQQWYRSATRVNTTASFARLDEDVGEDQEEGIDDEAAAEEELLPKLIPEPAVSTPHRRKRDEEEEERLTSSALRGGAAKGLLSLSQGPL